MGLRYNPFTGSFDMTRSPGSYLDGEVAAYSDLPLDTAAAPLNSAWLVRAGSGLWLLTRKPAGIYIRTATGGTDRDADYTYAGVFPDVFSDAAFTVYSDGDSTKNLQLSLSGIDTATTRTLTVPNASGTLPLLEAANTFTQNQTLDGTNNTAPNQTAASDSSLMTRSLVDARTAEYLFCERGFFIISPLQGAFTNAGSGSGALSSANGGFRIATGATASSSSLYRANPGGQTRFGRTNSAAGIQWSRRVTFGWTTLIDLRANGTLRLQFGRLFNQATIADLSNFGIGLIWDGSAGTITAEVHDGTTRSTGSCGTFLTNQTILQSIRMVSSGGTLTVYIDDSLAGTVSGAPTTDSGATLNNIHLSIENGAATTNYFADNPNGFRVFVA